MNTNSCPYPYPYPILSYPILSYTMRCLDERSVVLLDFLASCTSAFAASNAPILHFADLPFPPWRLQIPEMPSWSTRAWATGRLSPASGWVAVKECKPFNFKLTTLHGGHLRHGGRAHQRSGCRPRSCLPHRWRKSRA